MPKTNAPTAAQKTSARRAQPDPQGELLRRTREEISPFIQEAAQAQSPGAFLEGVQAAFGRICDWMGSRHARSDTQMAALSQCLTEQSAPWRQTRLLQLASWPALDKQMLPSEHRVPAEILWLFAMPLTVVLPVRESAVHSLQALGLELSRDQRQEVQRLLCASPAVSPQARVFVHNCVLSAEDIQRYGPVQLAQAARSLHLQGECETPSTPLWWDQDIESSRVLRLFVLCTAQIPLDAPNLWRGPVDSTVLRSLEPIYARAMQDAGFAPEAVFAHAPCALAETLLRCTACARQELALTLQLAKQHYGIRSVSLRLPMEGMAELWAPCSSNPEMEYLLKTPFFVVEPVTSLEHTLQDLCDQEGLQFSGTFSVAASASAVLQ